MRISHLLSLLSLSSLAFGFSKRRHLNLPPRPTIPNLPIEHVVRYDKFDNVHPRLNKTYYFDQLIDHDDPSKGTFKQRYWTS